VEAGGDAEDSGVGVQRELLTENLVQITSQARLIEHTQVVSFVEFQFVWLVSATQIEALVFFEHEVDLATYRLVW
jgi:hypothetical protein